MPIWPGEVLNIEARGMEEIRARHPEKARMIVQAIDMARYYAFNSLHNLAQLSRLLPGTRLDTFLKGFFDVAQCRSQPARQNQTNHPSHLQCAGRPR